MRTQPLQAKRAIGFLPEIPPVYLDMIVEDYMHFVLGLRQIPSGKRKSMANEAMEKCGVAEVRSRLIGNLSKGFRQRVGLAQAIAHKPPVLILDEPTVGLDPKQIQDIRNMIKSFSGEHTVVLSTHILSEVQAICERVLVIDHGKILTEDSVEGITSRMASDARIDALVRNEPESALSKIRKLEGVLAVRSEKLPQMYRIGVECRKDTDLRSQVARLCVEEKLELLQLNREQISLEEAFLRIIGTDSSSNREANHE